MSSPYDMQCDICGQMTSPMGLSRTFQVNPHARHKVRWITILCGACREEDRDLEKLFGRNYLPDRKAVGYDEDDLAEEGGDS